MENILSAFLDFKYKDKYPEVMKKLDHKNTMWKAFNGRSPEFTDVIQAEEIDRKMCAAFPQVPVIDFEKKHKKVKAALK